MSDLKDYWTQPPQAQNKLIVASQNLTTSQIRPKGCKCKVADAHQCARKQFLMKGKMQTLCDCACHTETGGFD